jgi:gliding motility-associated-like protein
VHILTRGLFNDVRYLLNLSVYQLVRMRKLYFCPLFTGVLFFLSGNILPAQPPEITGQNATPEIFEDTFVDLDINHLNVTDEDPGFPTGFTLNVEGGPNYTFEDTRVTPEANFNGDLTVRVSVTDPDMETSELFDFHVTVTAVNDAPVISGFLDEEQLVINEESTLTIDAEDLIISDVDGDNAFTVTVQPGANYSASGNTLTPVQDFFGTLNVGVTVNDGGLDSEQFPFVVTVNNVNDPPSMNGIAPLSLNAGTSADALVTGIFSGADNEDDPLEVSILQIQDASLFSSTSVNYVSPNPNGSITFAANSGVSGSTNVTVRLSDGQAFVEEDFEVTVQNVNASPTLDPISDDIIDEDAGEQVLDLSGITPGEGETGTQTVTVEAVSSMPSVIPNPTIIYGGGSTGQLRYEPLLNQFTTGGSPVTITVTVRDNEEPPIQTSQSFTVTVNSVNDPPTLNDILDLNLTEEGSPGNVLLSGISSGAANENDELTVAVQSNDNPTLFSSVVTNYTSPNNTGSITFTPAANMSGEANIVVRVFDGFDFVEDGFKVFVDDVNAAPFLDPIPNATIDEDAPEQEVVLTGISPGPGEESTQTVTVEAESSLPSIIPAPTISYSGGSSGSLRYQPLPNQFTSGGPPAVITVRLRDSEVPAVEFTRSFNVVVNSVNDPPVINGVTNMGLSIQEETTHTINVAEFNITDPDDDAFTVVIEPGPNYSVSGASLTPVKDYFGPITANVAVSDGEANSNFVPYNLTVTNVNDPPTLNAITGIHLMSGETGSVTLSGITTGAPNEDDNLIVTVQDNSGLFSDINVNYTSPQPTGSIAFTAANNVSGEANVIVRVSDGAAFVDQPVAMSVENVNATPFIDNIPDQEIDEDAGAQVINLSNISAGAGEEGQPVTVTAVSSNTTIIPNPIVSHDGTSANGTLTFQPAANQYTTGTPVTITVTVTDTEDPPLSYSVSFDVTVNAVNDFPELDALPNITIDEDSGPQTVNLSGISPGPEEGSQSVTITATSNNPTLIPNPTVNYSGGANGSISFTPAADRSGSAQITVTVTDNGSPQREVSRTFTVTVDEVNDPPTIDAIADVTVDESNLLPLLYTVNLTGISDGSVNELQDLAVTVTVSNNNPDLFVLPPAAVYVPPLPTATIPITVKPNVSGEAVFTVTVSDGVDQVQRTFTFRINAVNDPPSFELPEEVEVSEDAGPQNVLIQNVSPGPGETQNITFTAVSSNPTLIPDPTVSYTQGQTTATLMFEPASNQSGSATITVTAVDEDGADFTDNFTIIVTPVNDPPTIANPGTINIDEDAPLQGFQLTGISPGPLETQTLTITVTAVNQSLFSTLEVVYDNPDATGTLNIQPAPDQSGSTQVTITVTDSGPSVAPHVNTTQVTFTVNVNPVNDPPTIVGQDAVSVDEDTNFTILVDHLVIEDPDNTTGFTITTQAGANYTTSGTGGVVITPAPNYYGTLTIPLTVSDAAGGVSPVFNFQLTVNPVNDPPTITGQEPITIDEEESIELTVEHLHISDPDPEDVYPDDFTLIVVAGQNYSVTGTTITPVANFTGLLQVPVFVSDGTATSGMFTLNINVNPVNDPPIITGQAVALSIAEDQSVVLALNQLTVADPDTPPGNLTLIVQPGPNYTFSGLTVTPAANFNGQLHVNVVVNDGELNSAPFSMLVTVTPVNDPPEIVGQNPVTTTEDEPITLSLADLIVVDPDEDDPFPDAFTMTAFPGANYTLDGLTVIPALDFTGTLIVPVEVSDGQATSNRFNLVIEVTDENDIPIIVAQIDPPLITQEDTPVTIELSHLQVIDSDNTYPDDFTLVVQAGPNYTRSGTTVTPALDYAGPLTVMVRVNDGQNNSPAFPFQILVVGDNDPPTITGQKTLTVPEDGALEITLADLTVIDPDEEDVYPDDFTLTVLPGTNYTVENTTIRPAANYFGPLSVPVRVSDGVNDSEPFNLVVTVTPVNDPPSFAPIADVTIPENTENFPVEITGISPGPMETQNLSITATSSNEGLLPSPTFSPPYNGTSTTATILLNPTPNMTGTVTVTVRVIDPGLLEFTRTFTVTIEDINAAPTLDPIAFGPIPEDSPVQTIPLTGISAGPGEDQPLTVTAVADKPELFETFTLSYTSPQPTGSLTILPKPNVYGDVVITVTVADNGSNEPPHENSITRQFTLQITPVPDPPVFISEPVELALIGELYEYNIDVADADPGAVITIEAAQAPAWLSLSQVSNGKAILSGTPPPGSAGSQLISIRATDDTDLEVVQSFTLNVDTRPVLSDFLITAEEDEAKLIEKIRFDAAFTDADNDFLMSVRIEKLPPKGQLFVGTQAINEGQEISMSDLDNLTYKGLPDYHGRDTIVWNASDGRAYAALPARIFVNIVPVNDPPVIVNLETVILTVNAGEGPVQISTEFEVRDVDNEFLTGAEIGFRRQNFVPEDDLLIFDNTPKITGTYVRESGILTLTGTATIEEYNAAIRSIRYDNVSSVFSSEEVIKTISYTVSDGSALSVTRDREIRLIDTFEELVIPNAFTPGDGSGPNDLWLITNLERHVGARVRVYTIMGQVVYESDGVYQGWDGTYKGELLPADTYYYTIDLNLPFRKKVYKGAVTLLR